MMRQYFRIIIFFLDGVKSNMNESSVVNNQWFVVIQHVPDGLMCVFLINQNSGDKLNWLRIKSEPETTMKMKNMRTCRSQPVTVDTYASDGRSKKTKTEAAIAR